MVQRMMLILISGRRRRSAAAAKEVQKKTAEYTQEVKVYGISGVQYSLAASKVLQLSEKDAAIIIQKHARRLLSIEIVKNRKIELGLHQRLLMYLERYVVDGCLFSFVKSINDDYLRYERTIKTTIEREETMAMSFVQQVINTRDNDHSSAWERYKTNGLQDGKKKPPPNARILVLATNNTSVLFRFMEDPLNNNCHRGRTRLIKTTYTISQSL